MRLKNLYLFLYLIVSLSAENILAEPLEEKNSLDQIYIKSFIPKISLNSFKNSSSILNHYLKSHPILVSLDKKPLTWSFNLEKGATNAPVFLGIENLHLENKLVNYCYLSKSAEKEELYFLKPFTSIDFLEDIISAFTKSREYSEIKALFEPKDNHSDIDLLQIYLKNSLEFKVLSKVDKLSLLLDKQILKEPFDKSILLTNSIISKKKSLRPEIARAFFSMYEELKLLNLSHDDLTLSISPFKEEAGPIYLKTLSNAELIASIDFNYPYIPALKANLLLFSKTFIEKKLFLNSIARKIDFFDIDLTVNFLKQVEVYKEYKIYPEEDYHDFIVGTALGSVFPISNINTNYCYIPPEKVSKPLRFNPLSIEKTAPLKIMEATVPICLKSLEIRSLKKVAPQSLLAFTPKFDSITKSYLSDISYPSKEKNIKAQDEFALSPFLKDETFFLLKAPLELEEKYYFIEKLGELFFPKPNIKLTKLIIKENDTQKDPAVESFISFSKKIVLPFIAKRSSSYHFFTMTNINQIGINHLYRKRGFKSQKLALIHSENLLQEFDPNIYKKTFTLSNHSSSSKEDNKTPHKEMIHPNNDLILTKFNLPKKNPPSVAIDSSSYYYDKSLSLAQGGVGKMDREIDKESNLLFRDFSLDYLDGSLAQPKVAEAFKLPNGQKIDFIAKDQPFPLPYNFIVSEKIDLCLSPHTKDQEHLLSVFFNEIVQKEPLSNQTAAVLSEKNIPTSLAYVNYLLSDNLMFPLSNITHIPPSASAMVIKGLTIATPSLASTKYLNNYPILPKITKVNNENSFFLNPMLSLMGSETVTIESEITDSAKKTNRLERMTQYCLFNWPSLSDLSTDSFSEGFNLDTRLLTNEKSESTEFSCTLKPYSEDILSPLCVEILYILDTSLSIEPHRFKIFKDAIIGSMQHLDLDSKFNIAYLEDGHVELLHKEAVVPSASSFGFAKRALRKKEQSKKTHLKDLISFLTEKKINADNDETHHCCILLSDGNLANNIRLDQPILKSLTTIDASNFSLYTASVSDKNNKAMLSFLAKINHGFSLYTKTHSSFARKFAGMIKHLKKPLLHDIHISFPDSDNTNIYFNDQIAPILLANKEFTFYGNTDTKTSTRVFIQGKSNHRWVNILKELPISNARKARYASYQKISGQKSLLSLYSFLTSRDEQDLLKAKDFVKDDTSLLPL